MTYKPGTILHTLTFDGFTPIWTQKVVVIKTTRAMMPIPEGYHPVRFLDDPTSKGLLIHESRLMMANDQTGAAS